MHTSYFAKYKNKPNGISIAGGCPNWFKGKQYKKLAPKYWFFKEYKDGKINENEYIKFYYEEVLNKLDPQQVYNELGEDTILLCWEKSGEFCHRRLVAEWLEKKLGIEVLELGVE